MKEDTFTITIIEENKVLNNQVNKESFLKLMESIRDSFVTNNAVSKRFITIIPQVEGIIINTARNDDCDTPFVLCKMMNGGNVCIRIPRNHKIIWSILFECAK